MLFILLICVGLLLVCILGVQRIIRRWPLMRWILLGSVVAALSYYVATRPPPDAQYTDVRTRQNESWIVEHNTWSHSMWESGNTAYLQRAIARLGDKAYGKLPSRSVRRPALALRCAKRFRFIIR